jgi:hypothetical protein
MITEFEQELAVYLNTRLTAPFAGHATVSDGSPKSQGAQPQILVAVTRVEPQPDDMGPKRGEVLPGSGDLRRVLRLTCLVDIAAVPSASGKRQQKVAAIEQVQYLLDEPGMRNGAALVKPGDQGFLIHALRLKDGRIPFAAAAGVTDEAATLTYEVRGWFWPVGVAGVTGIPIGTIRLRGISHTIVVEPAAPVLHVNGAAQEFTISMHAIGTMLLADMPAPATGFGALYCGVRRDDGIIPSGVLGGGSAADDNGRIVSLVNGAMTITYTPGPGACREVLVIAFENGSNGEGAELGRVPIMVVEA